MRGVADDTEWAWAAGLFEGEGSILVTGRPGYGIRLQLKMTDEDVVRRFRDITGGVVRGPYQSHQDDGHKRKPYWMWQSDRTDPRHILRRFEPWLGRRRAAAAQRAGAYVLMPLFADDVPRV